MDHIYMFGEIFLLENNRFVGGNGLQFYWLENIFFYVS